MTVLIDVAGSLVVGSLGLLLFRNSGKVYSAFKKVFGSGAFPEQGRRASEYMRFIRWFGVLSMLAGLWGIISAIHDSLG